MTTATEKNTPETFAFQAEIKQLLDIVIHSLYTDKEVFVRELVSNASDALEKLRHEFLLHPELPGREEPLQIRIELDKDAKTITFVDNGIGMNRQDLVDNLGTIASSGTKRFLSKAAEAKGDLSLIGQFGVGFYSAFMVAKKVTVLTRSFHPDSQGYRWESDGQSAYQISEVDDLPRGTRITLELKDDADEFAYEWKIKDIVRRFSSFVTFPIDIAGEHINSVPAIWTRSKNKVKDEEYNEFFKFLTNESEPPIYRLHFTADAPLAIRALLFVPKDHMERFGLGKMDPGVDLYCKRVLIDKHPEGLLPEWMRFVKGVVDSDDLPLNISRETMQDSALIKKLGRVLASRFIKFLNEEAGKDAEAYAAFYETYSRFVKEGVATDFTHRADLAKLLRFESSKTEAGKLTTLAEYISRMKDGQSAIYYINGASRQAIESGPYIEALRARDYEVIYTYEQIDDFVFDNLSEFDGKPLRSADRGDLDLPPLDDDGREGLSADDATALANWLKGTLGDAVGSVRVSKRLVDNPAMVTTEGAMTATMQRLMAAMSKDASRPTGKMMSLEINPKHPLIVKLQTMRTEREEDARLFAEQLCDNALLAAGLMVDPRAMAARLNIMLSKAAGL